MESRGYFASLGANFNVGGRENGLLGRALLIGSFEPRFSQRQKGEILSNVVSCCAGIWQPSCTQDTQDENAEALCRD